MKSNWSGATPRITMMNRTLLLGCSVALLALAGAAQQADAQTMYTLTIPRSLYGNVWGDAQFATGNSISCGETGTRCSASFPAGTTVILQSLGNVIGGAWQRWAGACNGKANTCVVVMDGNKTVIPKFDEFGAYTLKIDYPGDKARVDVPGVAGSREIMCGGLRRGNSTGGGNLCSAKRSKTVEVVITALLSDGYVFKGWTGACGSQGNPCRIRPDADVVDISVQVGVAPPPPPPPRNVTIKSPFYGSVQVNGKTCPGECSLTVPNGTKLSFTATPQSADYLIQNWGEACAGQANPCTITMDADKKISVYFVHK